MNNNPVPSSVEPNSAALARLDRLERYLEADPGNPALLLDAFETALQCREWDRASFHLRHGQAMHSDVLSWRLKEGDLLLAQGRYAEAQAVLTVLRNLEQVPAGFASVVLHNLAYIEFSQGRYAQCVSEIAGHMEDFDRMKRWRSSGDDPAIPFEEQLLQRLWLRSLHRTAELDRAMAWTSAAEKLHGLDFCATGIASLIAIDSSDLATAQRWANAAVRYWEGNSPPEPLPGEVCVTQLTLALGVRQADMAILWADKALQLNHDDGRAWSGRAFALLLKGDLKLARRDFTLALKNMPGHIGTWHGQGWAELLDRDLDAAQESFKTALELDRNFAESHGGLAVVLALKKQSHLAKQHAERAVGLDKKNLSGRYAEAILNGEVNDAAAIQKLAERLLAGRTNLMP